VDVAKPLAGLAGLFPAPCRSAAHHPAREAVLEIPQRLSMPHENEPGIHGILQEADGKRERAAYYACGCVASEISRRRRCMAQVQSRRLELLGMHEVRPPAAPASLAHRAERVRPSTPVREQHARRSSVPP